MPNASRNIPHVAVWIETSRGYGRGLIRGVAALCAPTWSVVDLFHATRPARAVFRLAEQLERRRDSGADRRSADGSDVPRQETSADRPPWSLCRGLQIPTVGLDNRPVARMVFEHLRDRGFRHYGFCGLPPGEHVHLDQRRTFLCRIPDRKAGIECHVFEARGAAVGIAAHSADEQRHLEVLAPRPSQADRHHVLQR